MASDSYSKSLITHRTEPIPTDSNPTQFESKTTDVIWGSSTRSCVNLEQIHINISLDESRLVFLKLLTQCNGNPRF